MIFQKWLEGFISRFIEFVYLIKEIFHFITYLKMEEKSKSTTGSEQIKFKEKTNIFSLEVTYNENKVVFTLMDFTDWVIYGRTYTEEDIGK
jgi:hypothetical protein